MEDSKLADYHDKVAASAPRGGRGGLGALGEMRAASAAASTASTTGLYSYFVRAGEAPAGASAASKRIVFESSGDASLKRSRGASSSDAGDASAVGDVFDWHPAIRAALEAAARLQAAAGAGHAELRVPMKLVRKAVCSAAKRAETEALKAAGRRGKDAKASRGSKRSRQDAFQEALEAMARVDAVTLSAGEVGLTGPDLEDVLRILPAAAAAAIKPSTSSSDETLATSASGTEKDLAAAIVGADAAGASQPAEKAKKQKPEKKAKKEKKAEKDKREKSEKKANKAR